MPGSSFVEQIIFASPADSSLIGYGSELRWLTAGAPALTIGGNGAQGVLHRVFGFAIGRPGETGGGIEVADLIPVELVDVAVVGRDSIGV